MSTTRNSSELTFRCQYTYTRKETGCCFSVFHHEDAGKSFPFYSFAQLIELFDRYMDKYVEESYDQSIKQKLFTLRITGVIDGNIIPAFELLKREDCERFYELYPQLGNERIAKAKMK